MLEGGRPGVPSLVCEVMLLRHSENKNAPLPSSFPEGWYFVASRQEVLKAKLTLKTWMGENVVVWCGETGRVCVSEAFCPHMGSDLGPAAGGRICTGQLVCPFHGFEFDATGQCVATPFAPPPRTARLRVFETRELLGLIFAWWRIGGREPQWSLPVDEPDQAGWCDLDLHTMRFPGHPQETTENSVDFNHLRYVHGYDNVDRVGELSVVGPCLKSNFDFRRTRQIAGIASFAFDVTARTQVFGLGYSFVEVREHSIGMDSRLWVLATPVDGTLIDLTLVGQVRGIRKTQEVVCRAGVPPTPATSPDHE